MLRVALSKAVYRIQNDARTGRPQMPPDATATADVAQWPLGAPVPHEFVWRVLLDWDFKPYPTHHTINGKVFTHASPYTINFGDQIRGGTLTVFARTTCNGQTVWSKARAAIVGDNPTRAAVLSAFPRTHFGLIASKVGMVESGLRQFTPPYGSDPGGMPLISRSNDVGMMQLNAPSGSITSADQIWNWRMNLRHGLEMLTGKQRTAVLASRHATSALRASAASTLHSVNAANIETVGYLNFVRNVLGMTLIACPAAPPLSTQPGSGLLPGDVDADHLQLSQVERDAIRRYNGGREYTYAVALHPVLPQLLTAGWQVDPSRGGIRPTSGDPEYVRHVLQMRSGLKLDVPKPVRKPRHRRRHHAS